MVNKHLFCIMCISLSVVRVGTFNKKGTYDSKFILNYEAKLYCPSIPFCLDNTTDSSLRSCCAPCSCNKWCGITKSCCPDAAPNLVPEKIQTSCVDGYINNVYYNQIRNRQAQRLVIPEFHYSTIVTCADGSPCATMEVTDSAAMSDLVVVNGGEYDMAYRNRLCAECNGISDYKRWKLVVVKCREPLIDAKRLDDLEKKLYVYEHCAMLSVPPSGNADRYLCYPKFDINVCNATGKWDIFDEDMEEACMDDTIGSPFKTKYDDNIYKNVFCFMCNRPSNIKFDSLWCDANVFVPFKDIFSAYSKILSFNFDHTVVEPEMTITSTCHPDELYDALNERCRTVYCYDELVPLNGECVAPHFSDLKMKYKFHIGLRPSTTRPIKFSENMLFHQIGEFWSEHLPNQLNLDCTVTIDYDQFQVFIDNTSTVVYIAMALEIYKSEKCQYMYVVKGLLHVQSLKPRILLRVDSKMLKFKMEFVQANVIHGLHRNRKLARMHSSRYEVRRVDRLYQPFACPYIRLNESEYCSLIKHYDNNQGIAFYENTTCPLLFETDINYNKQYELEGKYYHVCVDTFLILSHVNKMTSYKGVVSLYVTCLSMVCILVTLYIYVRVNKFNQAPMVIFTTAIINLFVAQIVFQFGSGWTQIDPVCQVMGIAIHYFWLTSVFSMNAYCILVLKNLHTMYHPFRTDLLVSLSYIYGLPVCFVLTNVGFANIGTGDGHRGFSSGYGSGVCHINGADTRALLFGLPILLAVVSNCVIYVVLIYKIRQVSLAVASTRKDIQYGAVYFRLLLVVGLSWVFGFVNELVHSDVLDYVFIIAVAGQGIFLMGSTLLCRSVLNSISVSFNRIFTTRFSSYKNSSSKSTIITNSKRTQNFYKE